MDLSNISEEATERENVANVLTPILEISPQDGTAIIIRGHVNRGDEVGVPIYADLRDSAGDPIDPGSTLAIQYEAPSMDEPQVVTVPMENVRPYQDLSVQEQQNEEFVDVVKHELKGNNERLVIRDLDVAYVSIDSPDVIDWSNSRLSFESKAVRET